MVSILHARSCRNYIYDDITTYVGWLFNCINDEDDPDPEIIKTLNTLLQQLEKDVHNSKIPGYQIDGNFVDAVYDIIITRQEDHTNNLYQTLVAFKRAEDHH